MRFSQMTVIAWLVSALFSPVLWAVPSFSEVVVFGDSLSDTGNVNLTASALGLGPHPPLPYFNGRLSNGPVWVEQLADRLGLSAPIASLAGGTNYAYAGAKTGSGQRDRTSLVTGEVFPVSNVGMQIETYLTNNGSFNSNQIITLWAGANDLRDATSAGDVVASVGNMEDHLRAMNDNGAKHVLMSNHVDMVNIPAFNGAPPTVLGAVSALSTFYSTQLDELINRLNNDSTIDMTIYRFDTFGQVQSMIDNPAAFGFTNVDDAALQLGVFPFPNPLPLVSNPDEYLFWDFVHPTRIGHRVLGNSAFRVLVPVPEPVTSTLGLLSVAALGLSLRGRRQQ